MNKAKRRQLQALIDAHNWRHAKKDKGVSFATQSDRALALFRFFNKLHERLNLCIEPTHLRLKHVKALLRLYESEGQSAASLQKTISYLRTFCRWIGKPGMVSGDLADYLTDAARAARTYAAQTDASWEAHGVAPNTLIDEITAYDLYVGMQLSLQRAFGLRPKEAYMLCPHLSDKATYLEVERGTKGGRVRQIPIDSADKRAVLDRAKALVPDCRQHLGRPGLSLKQNEKRYYNVLAKFGITRKARGITGYGLRKAYGNDLYQALTGVPSPVRGGATTPKSIDDAARLTVAKQYGHARKSISAAYLGPPIKQPK
jgi:integrase